MPRISAQTVKQHREQVHQRVFAAFAELLAERGIEGVRMAELAERAGIGRTAIYHHFRDVEAVVVAFATHETTRYLLTLRSVLARDEDPEAQLRAYVRHHVRSGEQFHLGLGPRVRGLLSDDSRVAIRDHVSAVEQVLRQILLRGVEARSFTVDDVEGTMALVHSCLSSPHVSPGTIEEFVLRAVGAASPG